MNTPLPPISQATLAIALHLVAQRIMEHAGSEQPALLRAHQELAAWSGFIEAMEMSMDNFGKDDPGNCLHGGNSRAAVAVGI